MNISRMNSGRLLFHLTAVAMILAAGMFPGAEARAQTGPTIDVWYGLNQSFGTPGTPQIYCDILGNVSDPEGVTSLSYTLNGGAPVTLTVGPLNIVGLDRRLINEGDFIVDLLVDDMQPGPNIVVITAVDGNSDSSTETVTVDYSPGNSWPVNYDTDWGSLTVDGNDLTPDPAILEQAHVVDGQWTVIGDSVRTIDPGYDRLIGIGGLEWGDFEVEVPVTIHSITLPSEFGAGFILRWRGHTDDPHVSDQPKVGWNPLGDIGWLTNGGLRLWTSGNDSLFTVQENTVYWLKMRVETNVLGTKYSLKTWEDGQAEPDYLPSMIDQRDDFEPLFGSVLLVAHNADVSFGNVHIVPVVSPNVAPVAVADAESPNFNGITPIDILDNDYDTDGTVVASTVNIVTGPVNGTLTVDPLTGLATYQHDGLNLDPDSFTYNVEDNDRDVSNTATVTLTIVPNQPPVAGDDVSFVAYNLSTTIDVLANDDDSDGTIIPGTVIVDTAPASGLAAVNPDGSITYTHTAVSAEPDSFTYTVADESGDPSLPAMVRMAVGGPPPEDFYSDDFNTCDIDPLWQFIDPQGDATYPVIEGAFSGDAHIAMSVPGGSAHEPYNGILGAPYLIQSAQDKDFTLEAKFSSDLPAISFAEQGILVIQDNQTWVRFDFFSRDRAGEEVNVYGVTSDNRTIGPIPLGAVTSPMYLRVIRTGDNWDLHYSTNGTLFPLAGSLNHPMTVTGVGLFVGNARANPAFTTNVDYFSNSVDPVTETDDQELDIQLVTDVSGGGSVARNPDQSVYSCGDIVELTPTADAGWTFAGWTGDLTGMDNPALITMSRSRNVTANFSSASGTIVLANTSSVPGLSTVVSCAPVPVKIMHESGTDIREFTVTVELTDLELCNGLASITEGDYLSSVSATTFTPVLNPDGTYDVTVALNGTPCGATATTGTLFTLDVANSIPNGTGTIEVVDVELLDCGGGPVAAVPGGPASITIDTTVPAGVTNLAFSQAVTGNPAGNVTGVDLQWTDSVSGDAASVAVYRKGFGSYPEYSDGGGGAPSLPTDPLSEGWSLVGTVPRNSETMTDLHASRDYWYFCAQAFDGVGNPSAPVMAGGVLNYLLGDVSDGGDPVFDGDNRVGVEDLTLLGTHYGTQDGDPLFLNTLDIGPTDDLTVTGLPTTDDMIEFEDLMIFGLNYSTDVTAKSGAPVILTVPDPAAMNLLALHLPDLPPVGETFQANLVLASDGRIQGLTMPLVWDAGAVKPIAVQGGDLLTQQGGLSLTLSPEPGVVDVCLVGVRESGISGTGTVAAVTFEVLAEGPSGIEFGEVMARDQTNQPLAVATSEATPVADDLPPPAVSALHDNYPNPFNPTTTLAFDLAIAGKVKIAIYSIDGRLVKTLVDREYAIGRHTAVWDGRDHGGRSVASGTYLYTMEGPRIKQTRRMLLIK